MASRRVADQEKKNEVSLGKESTEKEGGRRRTEARISSLSGSGTSALFEVIIATLRCQKSEKKGDL